MNNEIQNTTKPMIAMDALATNLDFPFCNSLSEIAPPHNINKNIAIHGAPAAQAISGSVNLTLYCSVRYVGNHIKNSDTTNCTTKYCAANVLKLNIIKKIFNSDLIFLIFMLSSF